MTQFLWSKFFVVVYICMFVLVSLWIQSQSVRTQEISPALLAMEK